MMMEDDQELISWLMSTLYDDVGWAGVDFLVDE